MLQQPLDDVLRVPFLVGIFEPTLMSFARIEQEDGTRNGVNETDQIARRDRSSTEHIVV